eukprot:gene12865-9197_t
MNSTGNNKYSKDFKIPEGFDEVLRNLTREILRSQPEDINKFAYEYFTNEVQARALNEASGAK